MGSTSKTGVAGEGAAFAIGAWLFTPDGEGSFTASLADQPGPHPATPSSASSAILLPTSSSASAGDSTSISTLVRTPIGTHQVVTGYDSSPIMERIGDSESATPSDYPPARFPLGLPNSAAIYQQLVGITTRRCTRVRLHRRSASSTQRTTTSTTLD